jgi:DNA polymerase-3 subunit delta
MMLAACLVVGDDPYLVSQGVAQALDGIGRLSTQEFAPGASMADVLTALESTSMLEARHAVVVRDLDDHPAEVARRLAAYLEDPNPSCLLVITALRPPQALVTAVRQVGHVVEAARGRRGDVLAWLREQLRRAHLKAGADALEALVESVGEERMALAQAVDQLSLANGEGARLSADDVRELFHSRTETRTWTFVDAVAARRPGEALVALNRLLLQGETPFGLFWSLTRHVRMLLVASEAPAGEVAKQLRIPGWRAEKLVRQARGFPPGALEEAYRLLARTEQRIKAGEELERLAIERTVVAVAGG